jgi:metal-dependent amidase/aminoacylase/carboxypeptidase family protein
VIPDEVSLQLTVRSYEDGVREKVLAEIRHIALKTSESHRAPRAPEIRTEPNWFPAVYHDPALTERLKKVFERQLGAERVRTALPAMGAEDFGRFGRHFGAPGLQFNVGAAPASWGDGPHPGLHSSRWAPDPEPTIRTGAQALTRACLDLLSAR